MCNGREDFRREKCRNTCDNCADQGNWEIHNYDEQGRLVLHTMRKLDSLGLPAITLVQLKSLMTNSKEKKLERHRAALTRSGDLASVKHIVKGKHVVMTKDSCDILLQVHCLVAPCFCCVITKNA